MSVFDLSHWQPANRIEELVESGNCDGVILKLGERNVKTGEIELDPMFITHVNEAVRFGLPYGIYIMGRANNENEALEEAQWINDRVAELLNGQEPVLGTWFDLERPEVKRDGVYEDYRFAILHLSDWWGGSHKIGIYASYLYFEGYLDIGNMAANSIPVWNAQYGFVDSMRQNYPYIKTVLWQFTTNDDYQDENVWYGWY